MRILFVAADRMEYKGILTRMSVAARRVLGVHWARAGRLGEHDVLLLANGAGRERAAQATDAGCAYAPPGAIVSTGFCGALVDTIQIADLVAATRVNGFAAQPLQGAISCHHGVVRSIGHVALTAAEKSSLRISGACAVEMEAEGVAERAQALGVPFSCVRAVTDLASEDLANDFNSALRADGHFDTMKVLRGALCQPAARLPELWRMRNRCIRAARALGDFFADCRF